MIEGEDTSLRWGDYFLCKGDEFRRFWKQYMNDSRRDVLIVMGLGFDPRMTTAVEVVLEVGGQGKRDCLLLEFDEGVESPSKRYEQNISSNKRRVEELFRERGELKTKQIRMLSGDGRRIGSRSAARVLEVQTGYTDIVVDISAIPRSLYFPIVGRLLYLFDEGSLEDAGGKSTNVHVVVTENTILDSSIQGEGIDDKAEYIHGFGGDVELEATANIPRLWIPILGEKREIHLSRIYTLVNPKEICPVAPFPSLDPRRGDNLILEYRELLFDRLRVEPRDIIYVAEQNPFDVYKKITRTVRQYMTTLEPLGGCKVILSALSSKLLSIGALLAVHDLKGKGLAVGIAHIESSGYVMPPEDERETLEVQDELFSLWLAGECYEC